MERYLSFELSAEDAQQSDFATYTLGADELLPNYFGTVAPVNIFLGENNSGKSRFMREIMKTNPVRLFDLSLASELMSLINAAIDAIDVTVPDELFNLDISLQASASNEVLEALLIKDGVNRATRLHVRPLEDLPNLIELIKLLRDDIKTKKTLLDALVGDRIDIDVREMTGHLYSLKRVSTTYQSFQDNKFLGLKLSSVSNGYAVFHSSQAQIGFEAGSNSSYFNQKVYRNGIGEKISSFLNCVIDSVQPVLTLLLDLKQSKRLATSRMYIPTLRTVRTLTDHSEKLVPAEQDVMRYTTIADYKLKDTGVEVTTGLAFYPAIMRKVLANINIRAEFNKFENFLSETFFDGNEVKVVPELESTNILVAVAKEERAIPYLGDGIQAIILLLYPLFTAKKNSWIFIEEPETHLHPGFQRLFIKTITTHKVLLDKNLTIFLTTHSNHLLDFAIDESKLVNLFSFKKTRGAGGIASYQIQLTEHRSLSLLTDLGVQNSSLFLSNCTIWVEGITDRIYLKTYLALYLEHLKSIEKKLFSILEGLHFSFLEYAGANVVHYKFETNSPDSVFSPATIQRIKALAISNRIMLIADKDSGKDTQHEQRSSQEHAGFEYIVLEVREIENLLSPEIIVAALKEMYPRRIFDASLLNPNNYKHNYLGRYLKKKFVDGLPATFAGKSGTLGSKYKLPFAKNVALVLKSWNQLTPEAKTLTQRIFTFIIAHNPRLGSN